MPLDYTVPYLTETPAPDRLTVVVVRFIVYGPAEFIRMSMITGDTKYIGMPANTQCGVSTSRLYDKTEHLYFRDSFLTRKSAQRQKIFWGRGNGVANRWVGWRSGRHARELSDGDKYITLFKEMAASIASHQQPSGFWATSILAPEDFPGQVSSGTGFYCYALAWGINHNT